MDTCDDRGGKHIFSKFTHSSLFYLILLSAVFIETVSPQSQQQLSLQFNSETLASHSILHLEEIGEEMEDVLFCNTTRQNCCTSNSSNSSFIGLWVLPDGSPLSNLTDTPEGVELYQVTGDGGVALHRRRGNISFSPEGLYRCEVQDEDGRVDGIYIGLYTQGNGLVRIANLTTNTSSQSISCFTMGGPVTSLQWERDGIPLEITDNSGYITTEQIIDTEEASYVNSLTNTAESELLEGVFTCSVSNNVSNDTQSIEIAMETLAPPTQAPPTLGPPPSGVEFTLGGVIHRNNSIVSYQDIGKDEHSLICHTDKIQCCSGSDTVGNPIGEWRFPNRSLVQINSVGHATYRTRREQQVRFNLREDVVPQDFDDGIFECEVENEAGETVEIYIGIYPQGSGSPEITSLEYDMTSYTLSCLSTGGPPSLVTWTKDDITITTESTVFTLSQRITSYENGSYLNVLIGEEALDFIGNFTCAVENERGRSEESISFDTVPPLAPVIMDASSTDSTITITWAAASDTRFISHFELTYTYFDPCSSTINTTTRSLMGGGEQTSVTISRLEEDSLFNVCLVAINNRGESPPVNTSVATLSTAPSSPPESLQVSATSMNISITWERVECYQRNSDIIGYLVTVGSEYSFSNRTILGTESDNRTLVEQDLLPNVAYSISVAALNSEGLTSPQAVRNTTTLRVQDVIMQLNGERLDNHTVIDPNSIGDRESYSQGLFCFTNLEACCNKATSNGIALGGWYSSNGELTNRIDAQTASAPFYLRREAGSVQLARTDPESQYELNSTNFTGGLFRCEIPDDDNVTQTFYVGLYAPGTGSPVVSSLTYDSSSSSLTCTSRDGPASVVAWGYNLGLAPSNSFQEQEVDQSLGVYRSKLVLSSDGEEEEEEEYIGTYTCLVGNSRGNSSSQLIVIGANITNDTSLLQVGVPAFLQCQSGSGGQSSSIEWLNSTGHVLAVASNETELNLNFDPVGADVNNTVYTCRVTNEVSRRIVARVEGSGRPLNLTHTLIPGGVMLLWAPPLGTTPSFFNYRASCSPRIVGLLLPGNVTTEMGVTEASVSNLEDGAVYDCSVSAYSGSYVSQEATISITRPEAIPSGSPPSFSMGPDSPGPREVSFQWLPLPVSDRNGVITTYTITCNTSSISTSTPEILSQVYSDSGTNRMQGFRPNTGYHCTILAGNGAGMGPHSPAINITTMDEMSFFLLRLGPVANCRTWVGDQSSAKTSSITNLVFININTRCSSCSLTQESITIPFLDCTESSPQTVDYKAQMHGTPTTSSSQLLAHVEAWVEGGESIVLLNVAMSIDPRCQVEIASLDTQGCANVGATLPIVAVAAGGGGGGALLVVVVCCVLVLVCVCLRRRKRKLEKLQRRRGNNLDHTTPNITLQNMNQLDSDDNLSDDGTYARIPPPLPPSRVETPEDFTTIVNRSFRGGSIASIRYIPSHASSSTTNQEKYTYSEIDGSKKKKFDPTEYEKVFVPTLGDYVETEDSHPLSPLLTSMKEEEEVRRKRDLGENGGEVETRLLGYPVPPPNPAAVGNYGLNRNNPGFRGNIGSTPTSDVRGGVRGEDGGGSGGSGGVPVLPGRSMSISANPMYAIATPSALIPGGGGVGGGGGGGGGEESFDEVDLRDGYQIPSTITRKQKKEKVSTTQVPPPRDVVAKQPKEQTSPTNGGGVEWVKEGYAMYNIPSLDNTQTREVTPMSNGGQGEVKVNLMYDTPSSNTPRHELGAQGVNDKNQMSDGEVKVNLMYDTPPSNTPRHEPGTQRVNDETPMNNGRQDVVMYDIPPSNKINSRDKDSTQGVNGTSKGLGGAVVNAMYDNPRDQGRPAGSQGVNVKPPYQNIDITGPTSPNDPRLGSSEVTKVVAMDNATYDIPRSNSHSNSRTPGVHNGGGTADTAVLSNSNGLHDDYYP